MTDSPLAIARLIDHTLLKANAVRGEILQVCDEALANHFASVCVNSSWVPEVAAKLKGSDSAVCTVVGFPLGAMATRAKALEVEVAVKDGAQEIDMVIPVGRLLNGEYDAVEADISAVVKAASGRIVKVILETCLLTDEQIVMACELSVAAGAHFVKTSTGFSTAGATEGHVALMRRTVGPDLGVKASGGVRDLATLRKMVSAGATRIGTSSGVAIVKGLSGTDAY